ncbi:hypothetical protein [Lacihabitans soyangensis]|jgi:hypothetical protein|uniref:Uncharacterized protein n=1 Tax=Lacihabitans soyangensis TaxID=869394 RepID=A0AAE3H3K8_9BACT|nr:hypothetical protein [Lacihabitans soyangensis]MCP9763436.1 hypothetical protein [Lacihabitans soyangensis]
MNNQISVELSPYAEVVQGFKKGTGKPKKVEISESKKKIFEEAVKAWKEYSTTPEGKMLEADINKSDLNGVQQKISGILDSEAFQLLKKLLEEEGLDAGSFSIGLNIEAELIIGITATIGFAIGIGDNKGLASSEFITVGLDEGIDEGALVGVQFGLWANAPSDLGGYAWATEADGGILGELAGKVVYKGEDDDDILGVTIEIAFGEEDGIDEQECYTFIIGSQSGNDDGFLKPAYQPRKSNFLIIKSVTCNNTQSDGIGNANEVYFNFQADGEGKNYYYPTYDYMSMQGGDVWHCGRSVWFNSSVQVNLFDSDSVGNDSDPIGNFTIHLSDLTLNSIKTFSSTINYSSGLDTVDYTIQVELVAINVPTK